MRGGTRTPDPRIRNKNSRLHVKRNDAISRVFLEYSQNPAVRVTLRMQFYLNHKWNHVGRKMRESEAILPP